MATSKSSSSAPLLAIFGGLLVVGLVVGVLLLTGEDDQPDATTEPVKISTPAPGPAMNLSTPANDPGQATQLTLDADQRPTPAAPPVEGDAADVVIIMGHVEDMAKARQPDIEVNLFDDVGDYLDSVTTNEEGEFQFAWDEPLSGGWSLGTEPEPIIDPLAPGSRVPAHYVHGAAVLPGDAPVSAILVLAPAPRIEGHVVDAETGEPIELADVEAVSTAAAWIDEYQDTFTESDGTFVLPLVDIPAHGVLLRVQDDEDRFQMFGPFDLAPSEVRYIEVRLSSPPTLEGTVVNAADGTPVDGAEVSLLPIHDAFDSGEAWDITADDGSWVLDPVSVPTDQIWVYVEADELGPAIVHPTNADQPVDIRLGEPVVLRGTVTELGTGEPVTDAIVRVVLRGPSGLIEDYEDLEFCEDDGTFSIVLETVPPEAAEVFIESDEHVRFRMSLDKLAPTHLGQRQYNVAIEMRRIPGF